MGLCQPTNAAKSYDIFEMNRPSSLFLSHSHIVRTFLYFPNDLKSRPISVFAMCACVCVIHLWKEIQRIYTIVEWMPMTLHDEYFIDFV